VCSTVSCSTAIRQGERYLQGSAVEGIMSSDGDPDLDEDLWEDHFDVLNTGSFQLLRQDFGPGEEHNLPTLAFGRPPNARDARAQRTGRGK
jgi:hypothetical protein